MIAAGVSPRPASTRRGEAPVPTANKAVSWTPHPPNSSRLIHSCSTSCRWRMPAVRVAAETRGASDFCSVDGQRGAALTYGS